MPTNPSSGYVFSCVAPSRKVCTAAVLIIAGTAWTILAVVLLTKDTEFHTMFGLPSPPRLLNYLGDGLAKYGLLIGPPVALVGIAYARRLRARIVRVGDVGITVRVGRRPLSLRWDDIERLDRVAGELWIEIRAGRVSHDHARSWTKGAHGPGVCRLEQLDAFPEELFAAIARHSKGRFVGRPDDPAES